MRIPFIHGPGTVGREDRLVRGCIALSLVLLAGFAVAMSGEYSAISILVLALGAYFALTAALGRDPLYTRAGIDTRTEAEMALGAPTPLEWTDEPHRVVDLRTTGTVRPDDRSGAGSVGR